MIQFTNRDYPNFHIDIMGDNIIVLVSLNITADMKPFISPNLVFKSNKHLTLVLRTVVPLVQMNEARILSIANTLINKAMIICREAKQAVLAKEIEKVKSQTPRLVFNS